MRYLSVKDKIPQGIKNFLWIIGGFILIIILGIGLLRYINYKERYTENDLSIQCLVYDGGCINPNATEEEILKHIQSIDLPKDIAIKLFNEQLNIHKESLKELKQKESTLIQKEKNNMYYNEEMILYYERALKATEKLEE